MMEIERKFLIDLDRLLDEKPNYIRTQITQGYLNQDPERTVRVRIAGKRAYLTIKGKSSDNGLSRFEKEWRIAREDAELLMPMCTGVIVKTRYVIEYDSKSWEIDVFSGKNEGLIVAEIELTSETESITLPHWVTKEVTGDPKYYNSNLIKHPFKDW